MNIFVLILASVLTTSAAQVLYGLITLREGWYSRPTRYAVVILCLASSGGGLWLVLVGLTGGETLSPALLFAGCQALAVTLRVGSGLRGMVRDVNLAEERAKRIQATADETNERLKAMQELATGVRERLEEETVAIRKRLEEHDTRTQSDLDQVKDDLGAEQSKVRDALGEQQDTVRGRLEQDTNTRIREMQERGQQDQPEERTDRREGHEHRSDIDARLKADTETRSQERQDREREQDSKEAE